jgi:hypothetical protein
VGVHYEKSAENRVGDGVQRARGEGCNGQGDEAGGDDSMVLSVMGLHSRRQRSPVQVPLSQAIRLHTSQSSSGNFRGHSRGRGPGLGRLRFR